MSVSPILTVERSRGALRDSGTLTRMHTRDRNLLTKLAHSDRGDVPGWVLITLMTAGLVVVIWALAGPALGAVFEQAIERVTGF